MPSTSGKDINLPLESGKSRDPRLGPKDPMTGGVVGASTPTPSTVSGGGGSLSDTVKGLMKRWAPLSTGPRSIAGRR